MTKKEIIDIVKTSTMESEKLNDRAISGFLLDDQEDENYRLLIVGFLRKSYDNSLSSKTCSSIVTSKSPLNALITKQSV